MKWISKRYSGGTPDKARPEFWTDGTIPWLNSGAVNTPKIVEPSAYITKEAFENSSAKWIPAGALVMALAGQGKTKGMTAQVLFETTCNQSMAAIIPTSKIDARYLFWWLTQNYQNVRNMAGGDLRDGLNLELVGSIPCPLPTSDEQISIATFLDRETEKIDKLITEQEKLLTLLAEKRQATVSHAVTHGINPNAPMKNSGVTWLGEVPAHWRVLRVKYLVACRDGIQMGPFGGMLLDLLSDESGYKVYGQENTISGNFLLGNRWISEERFDELERYQLRAGDLVVTRKGSLGNARLISQLPYPGIADSDTIRIRIDENTILPELFALLLHECEYVANQIAATKRGAILSGLNSENIANLVVTCPPISEQRDLLNFLVARMEYFDNCAEQCNKGIALLKERRSALIVAAVTGKIDVRESPSSLRAAA
ncbi:restriction endonuclease subunit S [Paraburkholderia strydomiana]|uniref:restriction endonuclease subunit S n=1 Tax=Paraburkholderia strydomiana TaxID=1245417 RepID=UPI0038B81AE0